MEHWFRSWTRDFLHYRHLMAAKVWNIVLLRRVRRRPRPYENIDLFPRLCNGKLKFARMVTSLLKHSSTVLLIIAVITFMAVEEGQWIVNHYRKTFDDYYRSTWPVLRNLIPSVQIYMDMGSVHSLVCIHIYLLTTSQMVHCRSSNTPFMYPFPRHVFVMSTALFAYPSQ